MIEGLHIVNLKIIKANEGRVLHGLKKSEVQFNKFGEAYFSTIYKDKVKAWKKHNKMSLNLIVPLGEIRFIIYDDRNLSSTYGKIEEIILSDQSYKRLTIPPKVWVGFQGCYEGESFLLNVADMEHDPSEVDRLDVNKINFDWKV